MLQQHATDNPSPVHVETAILGIWLGRRQAASCAAVARRRCATLPPGACDYLPPVRQERGAQHDACPVCCAGVVLARPVHRLPH